MTYISKGKKGWYIKVVDEYQNEKTEGYIQISFKRGTEPLEEELNDYNSLDGDLYFIHNGKKRKVFPACYRKSDGTVGYKLIFLGEEEPEEKKADNTGLVINADELPFY